MPSTHLSLHYHLVFGTKDHTPIIDPAWRADFHAYIGGVVRTLGGVPEAVGGVADHVHILAGLRATHCLADAMRELKAVTSRWVHVTPGVRAFAWQEGYGAFTVSASQRDVVRQYIGNQEEHHRKRTFREEYLELLQRSGVEFDARYVF
jgi:REP element-mobilizing transposase RayT